MKLTNKYNAPEALVNLIESLQYNYTPKSFGATTLNNAPQYVQLYRRHENELEQDVCEATSTLFGTVTHSWLEKYRAENTLAEIKFKEEIKDGYYLAGVCDVYDSIRHKLIDWKTGTVWKVKFADFEDWHRQAMIYTYLLEKSNYKVNKVEFWCFMKDWSKKELRLARLKGDNSYPEAAWYCYEFYPTEEEREEIKKYIEEWFDTYISLEDKEDSELGYCGDDKTWYDGDSYAIYQMKPNGSKPTKATRVFKKMEDASEWVGKQPKGAVFTIEKRTGEHKKCIDWCPVCKYCRFYKDNIEGKEGV